MNKINHYKYILPSLLFWTGFFIGAFPSIINQVPVTESDSFLNIDGQVPIKEILINNFLICIIFILGCGLLTLILVMVQGIKFGIDYSLWVLMGNNPKMFWTLFLPHVLFEIAAMSVSVMVGFELLNVILNKDYSMWEMILKNRRRLLLLFTLILTAGLVECYVTPAVGIFLG